MKKALCFYFLLIFNFLVICAQKDNIDTVYLKSKKNSVDLCPVSPLIDIYGVHYNRKITPKDELIIGLAYMNIKVKYEGLKIGETHSPGLIVGYRRYVWKNLHVEYQLWPCYDKYYETAEQKYYKSFDIWNEFRVGYQFDFKIMNKPCYTNIQWPLGFGLFASNKPESFKAKEKKERFFYQFPLVFVGIKF